MTRPIFYCILLCALYISCSDTKASEDDTAVDDSSNIQERPSDSGTDALTGDTTSTGSPNETDSVGDTESDSGTDTLTEDTSSMGSSNETDSDDDTDSESESDQDNVSTDSVPDDCDGKTVDCYKECWDCALAGAVCRPALTACLTDTGCNAFYECMDQVCCDNDNTCLTGDAWMDCIETCSITAGATEETFSLYRDIERCVACDVCEISCGQNKAEDFAMCTDVGYEPDVHCYQEEAEPGETACFTWAVEGPCADVNDACRADDRCEELDRCVADSWSEPDAKENWEEIQEPCFATAGQDATDKYWAWMQCIYCDACDIPCARDAVYRKCDTYEGK